MVFAMSSWSVDGLLTSGFPLSDLPAAARDNGIGVLELCHFHLPTTEPGYLEAISKTLKQEFDAAELQQAKEVIGEAFVTNDQAAEVAEVSKQPLDLPAPLITSELPTVLGLGLFAVVAVRGDHVDVLLGELGV